MKRKGRTKREIREFVETGIKRRLLGETDQNKGTRMEREKQNNGGLVKEMKSRLSLEMGVREASDRIKGGSQTRVVARGTKQRGKKCAR